MVEGTSQLKSIIARYQRELARSGVRVTAILLYGSYARGTNREDSDIDLIVVSPDFAKYNVRERLELLGIAAARILEPVQAYGLTPEEIGQHVLPPFLSNIMEHEVIPV